jgi:hypothetical protein
MVSTSMPASSSFAAERREEHAAGLLTHVHRDARRILLDVNARERLEKRLDEERIAFTPVHVVQLAAQSAEHAAKCVKEKR